MTSKALAPVDEVRNNLMRMTGQFKMALPAHIPPERFIRYAMTAIQNNPDLYSDKSDRRTLYSALMKAAQDGLIPDGREAALVLFGKDIQYMPMVEGLMKRARNSGMIKNWSVQVVKENDEFAYELGDNEHFIHKPKLKDRGPTIGAYSIVTLKDGEKSREWMDIDQLNTVRAQSKMPNGPAWKNNADEMYRKTVCRRHIKRLPKSTDNEEFSEFLKRDDETMFDFNDEKPEEVKAEDDAIDVVPEEVQEKKPLSGLKKNMGIKNQEEETVVEEAENPEPATNEPPI